MKQNTVNIPVWAFTLLCGMLLTTFSIMYMFGTKVAQIDAIDKRLIRIENKIDNLK
ncbi:MAG: hypothetical protein WC069_06880 [Candidatus Shapirobacteria bacterium]